MRPPFGAKLAKSCGPCSASIGASRGRGDGDHKSEFSATLQTEAVAAVILGAQISRLLDGFSHLLPASAQGVAGIYFSLWFPRQLPCFVFGIMLFRFSREQQLISVALARWACVVAIALMLLVPFLEGVKYALPLGLATTYAIASLFAFSLIYWRNSPLVGRQVIWIGKVSFSAYFVHFAVLHYLPPLRLTGWPIADLTTMYAAVTIVTVFVSSITLLMIEKPMIRLGAAVIAERKSWSLPPRLAIRNEK